MFTHNSKDEDTHGSHSIDATHSVNINRNGYPMKLHSIRSAGLGLFLTVMASTVSLASGNHAGGHTHAEDGKAYGKPGVLANVSQSVTVDMTDAMRFTPSSISVKKGETIRFVIKNSGQVRHEFSLGTQRELAEHAAAMKKFPNMEHDEPNMVSLAPGEQGEVIWQFTKPGKVDFACLQPGHFEAGMKGQIKVAR